MKNETDALNETIALLKDKQNKDFLLLTEQLKNTYESLKPLNILKSSFKEVRSSSDLKGSIISNAIGIATGFISKSIWMGNSHNPIKNVIGTLMQLAVSNIATRYSDSIKSVGEKIMYRFSRHKEDSKNEFHHNGTV